MVGTTATAGVDAVAQALSKKDKIVIMAMKCLILGILPENNDLIIVENDLYMLGRNNIF
jgi:hypothetical protein